MFFGGKRVGWHTSSANYYYIEDHLGSSRVITDSSGNKCYDADFLPYGQEVDYTGTCGSNYKFEGKERDTETGNDNFGARYYRSALGRMVEQSKSGTNTEIVYDCLGNKLALMNGTSTVVKAFVPLPGGGTAVYNANGLQYYRHPDWLGSARFASTPSRTMYNDLAYAPFGEQYAQSGSTGVTDTSFAGMNEDTTTNLYDAYYREYGIQGRWPSPDPAGIAAANPVDPQSWNRYAYVVNNPLSLADAEGLDPSGLSAEACDFLGWSPFPFDVGFNTLQGPVDFPWPCVDSQPLTPSNPKFGGGGGGGNGSLIGPSAPILTNQTLPPCVKANFVDNLEIPLLHQLASATNETVGTGLTLSAAAGQGIGVAGGASAFLVVTPSGQSGFLVTGGITRPFGLVGGAGVFGGPAFLQSSAANLSQLNGTSVDFGTVAADGLGGGADISVGSGFTVTTVISAGFGVGGNGHSLVIQNSRVIPICQ